MHDDFASETSSPAHAIRALWSYQTAIAVALASVALLYGIVAVVLLLAAGSDRSTTLRFRLNFEGASEGRFPNRQRFSPADIVSTWVVNDVFQADELSRFTTPAAFARALAVVDSNNEYEAAWATYQARLTDPRLTPIDRERVLREWEAKQ